MTGYEVRKKFSLSFSFFSELSYGSIYPALKALHKDDLISMQDEIDRGPRRRKVYKITASGRKVFMAALTAPLVVRPQKNEFLMRLFFFSSLTPAEQQGLVTTYLESIRTGKNQLEAVRPEVEEKANRWQLLCLQFGLRFYNDLTLNVETVLEALKRENTEGKGNKRRIQKRKTNDTMSQ